MFDQIDLEWQGRALRASVPPRLAELAVELPEGVVRVTERAVAAIERSNDQLPVSWEPLARLLLRFEGVASSAVEQIHAPLEEIAAAEVTAMMTGPSAWVADNLAVVSMAVQSARDRPLSAATLLDWHRRLMQHAANQLDPGLIGAFRHLPVWVGGTSPRNAAYVGPPPDLVTPLIDDLIDFANSDALDVVTQAAILHAQFESIHPFADGNGRLGRVLIGWLVVRRLNVLVPPPFSVFVARDPGGYLSGLALYQMGELTPWVRWFGETLERSASSATSLISDVDSLMAEWRSRARTPSAQTGRKVRAGATLWPVLEILPEHPILSVHLIEDRFKVSNETARQLLQRLQSLGILSPIAMKTGGPGRPVQWWAAKELIDVVARSN
jgi:Fic family protein